jgi:hypothetical protein
VLGLFWLALFGEEAREAEGRVGRGVCCGQVAGSGVVVAVVRETE